MAFAAKCHLNLFGMASRRRGWELVSAGRLKDSSDVPSVRLSSPRPPASSTLVVSERIKVESYLRNAYLRLCWLLAVMRSAVVMREPCG